MCMYVCACMYVSVCHICVGAFWGQERHWVPWSWGSLLLWTSWCSAGNSCLSSWTAGSTHLLGHLSSLLSDQTSVCYDWETSWITKNLEVYLLQQADRTQVDVLMLPTYIVLGRTFCESESCCSQYDWPLPQPLEAWAHRHELLAGRHLPLPSSTSTSTLLYLCTCLYCYFVTFSHKITSVDFSGLLRLYPFMHVNTCMFFRIRNVMQSLIGWWYGF